MNDSFLKYLGSLTCYKWSSISIDSIIIVIKYLTNPKFKELLITNKHNYDHDVEKVMGRSLVWTESSAKDSAFIDFKIIMCLLVLLASVKYKDNQEEHKC